jgi:cytochrome c556
MRTGQIIVVAFMLAVFALGAAQAQTVVIPDKATPAEEVALRKFAMRALNSNLRDIRLKLKRGDTEGLLTPALNISSIAQLLPYVFQKTHESAYPFEGSNKFFKGADPATFQANAEYLNAQAMKLLRLASGKDLKAMDQQNERIKRACIGCHKEMRGEKQ